MFLSDKEFKFRLLNLNLMRNRIEFLFDNVKIINCLFKKKDKSSPLSKFTNQQILSPNVTLNTSMDSSMSYSQAQLTMSGMPVRYSKLKGRKLYLNQFSALILKRFHHHRRNFRILMTNLLLPCFFVALSMAFTSIKPKEAVQPSLEMSPIIYNPNSIFIT